MRRALPYLITCLLALTGCAPQGRRPDPGTTQPTRPHGPPGIPGFRDIYLGVQVRSAEGVQQARISVLVDAFDDEGKRGTRFSTSLPYDTEVDSGWEYRLQIAPDFPHTVYVLIHGTAVGLKPGQYIECWIRDSLGTYYDQEYTTVSKQVPSGAITARCAASIPPLAAN
jgi:hypothetical protein